MTDFVVFLILLCLLLDPNTFGKHIAKVHKAYQLEMIAAQTEKREGE